MRLLSLLLLLPSLALADVTVNGSVIITSPDAGDNGKRDWSDAQIRIAIEAELRRADR